MKKLIKISVIVLLILWFVFQFLITYHRNTSIETENSIQKGKLVWINKASVGAWFLGMKMPGYSKIKRNDLIYYANPRSVDEPMYSKKRQISRVIGLPGDKITIIKNKIIVNGKTLQLPKLAKISYRIVLKSDTIPKEFIDKYNIKQIKQLVDKVGVYEATLTTAEAEKISKDSTVDYIRELKYYKKFPAVFPDSQFNLWSIFRYGPLRIPAKGSEVMLTFRNIDLYKFIIQDYENNHLMIHKAKMFINNKQCNTYTFKKNYYFVINDNRDQLNDSRTWGFVPEEYIIGKPIVESN